MAIPPATAPDGATTIRHYPTTPRLPDDLEMARYLFSSHDGYGLGHARRNGLIASVLLEIDPAAEITLVTGTAVRPSWFTDKRLNVVKVPALLKDGDGVYRNDGMSFEDALSMRSVMFEAVVDRVAPDVIVIDRHPFGIANELGPGLRAAAANGTPLVLGLRDILDEPSQVVEEMLGRGWEGVPELFSRVLVYGDPAVCDHQAEYGLAVTPTYCGWVVEHPVAATRDPDLVVVTAGGGGDGRDVFRLGLEAMSHLPTKRGVMIAGPYAAAVASDHITNDVRARVEFVRDAPGCGAWFSVAGAVIQMAGYNSTFESLAAGVRPVLIPRRSPRREQAIRATRLAALGLADVIDEGATAAEVAWLLQRPRLISPDEIRASGLSLDGAIVAAHSIASEARTSSHSELAKGELR